MGEAIIFSGELRHITPDRLLNQSKDDVGQFFLVLGTFYNDLKSLLFHMMQTERRFESVDPVAITVERGEFGGIRSHLVRIIIATVHEFFKFIDENNGVMDTEEFGVVYSRLNNDQKERWNFVIEIAKGGEVKDVSDFAKVLKIIRNNLSFHYYGSGKVLGKGFGLYFYEDRKMEANRSAYYSKGSNMSETRYFFCDAAAQRGLSNEVSRTMNPNEFDKKFSQIIDLLNLVVMKLMNEFVRLRSNMPRVNSGSEAGVTNR